MKGISSFGKRFGQVAWVVRDINAAEKFFREVVGIPHFVRMENLRAQDLEGTYNGKPSDFSFHLYMSYSGESLFELIQPLSGESIFSDYLKSHPEGGVQHIAYMVTEAELDEAIRELTGKGYPVIQTLTLPVARVAFFDTSRDIGVFTEIIGVTEAGNEFVAQLKSSG